MKALIVKELRQTFALPLIVIVAASAIWLAAFEFRDVLQRPGSDAVSWVIATAAAMGALLGYLQFASERWFGTAGYLQHRGGGARAIFRAKASVGLPAAWLAGFVPPLVYAAVAACGPNAAVIHWERLFDCALLSLAAIAPYCAAAWTAQLRRGWREIAILLWTAGSTPLVLLIADSWAENIGMSFTFVWVASCLGAGAALYSLALRAFRDARDRELALGDVQHIGAVVIGATACLLVVSNVSSAFQDWVNGELLRSYPRIWQDVQTGEVFAGVRGDDREIYRTGADGEVDRTRGVAGYEASQTLRSIHNLADGRTVVTTRSYVTDARGVMKPVDASSEGTVREVFAPERAQSRSADVRLPQGSRRFGQGYWYHLGNERFEAAGPHSRVGVNSSRYFDREAGVVRVAALIDPVNALRNGPLELALDPPYEITAPRGDGRRFSEATECAYASGNDAVLVDHGDNTLWHVHIERGLPVIDSLALPDGDQLLPLAEYASRPRRTGFPVRGRATDYSWVGRELVSVDRVRQEEAALRAQPGAITTSSEATVDANVTNVDPLAVGVSIVDIETRKELFDATFEPKSLQQRVYTLALQLATLLKPPAIVASSTFLLDPDEQSPRSVGLWGTEPLVAGGKRPWLVAVVLAWGAFLTIVVVREKRRYGYPAAVVVLSGVLTAIFGVWAVFWLSLLDPRRCAARKIAEQPDPQPALVIQSA